jgi:hypothetical protein
METSNYLHFGYKFILPSGQVQCTYLENIIAKVRCLKKKNIVAALFHKSIGHKLGNFLA